MQKSKVSKVTDNIFNRPMHSQHFSLAVVSVAPHSTWSASSTHTADLHRSQRPEIKLLKMVWTVKMDVTYFMVWGLKEGQKSVWLTPTAHQRNRNNFGERQLIIHIYSFCVFKQGLSSNPEYFHSYNSTFRTSGVQMFASERFDLAVSFV